MMTHIEPGENLINHRTINQRLVKPTNQMPNLALSVIVQLLSSYAAALTVIGQNAN